MLAPPAPMYNSLPVALKVALIAAMPASASAKASAVIFIEQNLSAPFCTHPATPA
jgi:hypothetical protein